jgi:hypothetical protein
MYTRENRPIAEKHREKRPNGKEERCDKHFREASGTTFGIKRVFKEASRNYFAL